MASHLPPPLNAGGGASATARTTAIMVALTFVGQASEEDPCRNSSCRVLGCMPLKQVDSPRRPDGALHDGGPLGGLSWSHGVPGCLRFTLGRFLYHSAAVPRDEGGEVRGGNPDRVQDADVRELTACAEAVNRRGAHAKAERDLGHIEQIFLDLSWTRRFVFGRCPLGDSWIGLC